ncbi:2,5-diketo-D-gluconic acid reductase [Pacificimonas flava]|uniref:2,5-diketo-D-gluconic acid reductase n=2 Tax=Pacificimonas TaxID=1960290 RepID=A0A219B5D5_9SPHN|nr:MULTISPECIES: aldo/keto reductase [Pacificimonas]MBZ6377313.1 aldo/keto reductase [Pacificimonas aurantium]OWV32978.1 2,5-diketo-D-gluconic acid reductase [Pacificimonas flava]
MIFEQTYQLNNGVSVPSLGFGTWMIDDARAAQVVRDAADIGYRHFDTAQAYGNEAGVGDGLRTCGVPRDELFVTTKLDAGIKSFEEAKKAIDGSLETMGLETIDMMIIHSPQPWDQFRKGEHFFDGNLQAWRALEEALQAGKLRAIGVSNFEALDIDNILDHGSVPPAVNQVLAHVANTPFDLVEYCESRDILVEAYSPMGHGEILDRPDIRAIADKYGVSTAQLCIRYCLQLGLLPLPKTGTPSHMRANAEVGFEIAADDMDALKTVAPIRDYGEASSFPVYGDDARSR